MPFSNDHLQLDTICHRIADGRRWARQLALTVRKHGMSEAEFRLLWLLQRARKAGFEQRGFVEGLGISPAQVSALVEKLRSQEMISPVTDDKDRRRKFWRMTASGHKHFQSIVASVGALSRDWVVSESTANDSRSLLEDAA